MKAKEVHHALFPLQTGNVDVQVHPIDTFDFQGDVIGQHLGHASWYAHFRLRYDSDPSGSTAASAAYILGENRLRFSTVDRSHFPDYANPDNRNTPRRSEAEPR